MPPTLTPNPLEFTDPDTTSPHITDPTTQNPAPTPLNPTATDLQPKAKTNPTHLLHYGRDSRSGW